MNERIIVTGYKSMKSYKGEYETMCLWLDRMTVKLIEPIILTRGAGSCDSFAAMWARPWWLTVKNYWPDPEIKDKKKANTLRNQEMISEADAAIIFHDGRDEEIDEIIAILKSVGMKKKVIMMEG
jgi:hypothetical protein